MKGWLRCFVSVLVFLPLQLAAQEGQGFVYLASTIGPIDAGIVDALETAFEKDTGLRVRHVGAGTGAALELAKQGSVDLVLVHAKALEEKFVAEGYGVQRVPLMYNDFVLVGPASDPAGIRGLKSAVQALQTLASKAAPFITRGDQSGTHVAEKELWSKAGVKPQATWYKTFTKGSEGNVPTLLYTDAQNAYTVIDRASYLGAKDRIKLAILVEGDEVLLNHISLIPVNPAKFPKVNLKDAMTFLEWLTAVDRGQKLIADFGKEKYGQPLFMPESKAWKAAQPSK
ncbi:MAG: substrate-binding domain-containing protein [Holophagaceae bacterium]|nr:substrate-binding domain-containing protein [Holophagaceae bacterium]